MKSNVCILTILLSVTFIIFDYFLLVYGIKEVLDIEYNEFVEILGSVFTLISIGAASIIGLYTINENRRNILNAEHKKDKTNYVKSSTYTAIIMSKTRGIYNAFSQASIKNFSKRESEVILSQLSAVEEYANDILELEFIHESSRSLKLINTYTSVLLELQAFETNRKLHQFEDWAINSEELYKLLKTIHNYAYDYFLLCEEYTKHKEWTKL